MVISDVVVEEFRERMKIYHQSEDDDLKRILSASFADIKAKCGEFLIDQNIRGKELVFERSRYVYNDALEHFDDNFIGQMLSLSLELKGGALDEDGV